MYKVFIDNTPLHIVQNPPDVNRNAVVIYCDKIKNIREAVFSWTDKVKNFDPVYLVTSHPEIAFARLFDRFDFIEAAGGIVQRDNKFLFIKRNGFWDIPKGKLDLGESSEIGAIREIEEECGIENPEIDFLIAATYHTYKLKNRPTIKRTYWYALKYSGDPSVKGQLEEGITKVKWFGLEELFKVRENTFSSILDVMETFFEKKGVSLEE